MFDAFWDIIVGFSVSMAFFGWVMNTCLFLSSKMEMMLFIEPETFHVNARQVICSKNFPVKWDIEPFPAAPSGVRY